MPDTLKIRYVKTTKPYCNTKLLHIVRERCGLKYHREFNLGGSGLHTTFVLVLSANSCVPAGARKYFLSCVMQAGIDALDANFKTVSHGVPQTDNFDGSQPLKLFAEDSPTVRRCVDEYLREKKRYSNDIYQRYDNNAAAVTAATANDHNFPYYRLSFVYYRCQYGILASPTRVLLHLSAVTFGHTDAIMLIQLHFGTVAAHNDRLPLFLYLATATRLFHRGANKTLCRCFDTKHGGYVTCRHSFGIAAYPEISYFQTYDPTYHTVLNQRQANMTLYTIFGDYKTGTPHIKGKMAFMSNFIESHRHRLNQLTNNLRLRFEIVVNVDTYAEAVNALLSQDSIYINLVANMFIVNNDDDDDNNENHHDITNLPKVLAATGAKYVRLINSAERGNQVEVFKMFTVIQYNSPSSKIIFPGFIS